jgi:TonB family protein
MIEDNDEDEEGGGTIWRWLAVGLVGAVVVVGLVSVMSGPGKPPRPQTSIMKVVLPPPPPPPPPKKQEPLPEPKLSEPVKNNQSSTSKPVDAKPAAPKANAAPAGHALTAAAGVGSNAYGLAVGNGGGDTIGGGGGGGGGGGNQYGGFAGAVQSEIELALQRDDRTRRGQYQVMLRLWFSPSGQITRAQLTGTSGDASRDEAVLSVINALTVNQRPAPDMPQPVTIRVKARLG